MEAKKTVTKPAAAVPPPRKRVAVARPRLKQTDQGRVFEKRMKQEFSDLMASVRGVVHDKDISGRCCTALARVESAVLEAILLRFGEEE